MKKSKDPIKNLSRSQQRRREDILDASLKIFDRDGFEAARMVDIAEDAGVAKGTIYLYFDNKNALLEGVIEAKILTTLKAVGDTALTHSGSAEELLRNQMRITAHRIASPEMAMLLRIMISGGPKQHGKLVKFYYENVARAAVTLIGQTLKDGVKSGEFRKEVANIDPLVLVGAQIYTTVWKLLFENLSPIDIDELSNDLMEVSLRGLLA